MEPFSRGFTCILGCRHLLSPRRNGVAVQVYPAPIARVLVVLGTGRKPNRRTFGMPCLDFQGWAGEGELIEHLKREHAKKATSQSTTPDPSRSDRGGGSRRAVIEVAEGSGP